MKKIKLKLMKIKLKLMIINNLLLKNNLVNYNIK